MTSFFSSSADIDSGMLPREDGMLYKTGFVKQSTHFILIEGIVIRAMQYF